MEFSDEATLGQESGLHGALKEAAYGRLRDGGFRIYFEPSQSPCPEVGWSSFRPDLFAVRLSRELKEFVLVECETHPSSSSLREKSIKLLLHLWLQTDLATPIAFDYVIAMPKGSAHHAFGFRELWDLWIVDVKRKSVVESIPRIGAPRNSWFPKDPVYSLCKRLGNPRKGMSSPPFHRRGPCKPSALGMLGA